MKAKKEKEMKRKFFEQRPKYSQMELRAMERKRLARPMTPMMARVKRKQEFWDFKEKEKEKEKEEKENFF